MFSGRNLPELRVFAKAETKLPLRNDSSYEQLVVAGSNENAPVHSWFKYKESFSADLLERVLTDVDLKVDRDRPLMMLDPYCGVGTSLVASQLLVHKGVSVSAVGVECNPFSAFVARTKASWPDMRGDIVRELAATVLTSRVKRRNAALPSLSSINDGKCIAVEVSAQILSIRAKLQDLKPCLERDALSVGLASCIEPASKVRRDGRALRIVKKPRVKLEELLSKKWESIASDVDLLHRTSPEAKSARVHLGDGRTLDGSGIADESIDLVLTSPPYPNNIDYNEVYKLELWLMGFVDSSDEFLRLRRHTVRSHPTCSEVDITLTRGTQFERLVKDGLIADLMGIVFRRVDMIEREHARGRKKVLVGYIYDMWVSLKALYQKTRKGGVAIFVVGNSLHGGATKPYLVPTDLILSRLAKAVGFEVDDLIIARPLRRRLSGNHFLRDSLVVLRKR